MKLIYCCQPPQFYHAVSCWINDRQDYESLFVLPAFKDLFLTNRAQCFLPRTSILSFDSQKISEYLKRWSLKNVTDNPRHTERIHLVSQLMKDLVTDESWATQNKLIVSGCYTPEEIEDVLS